MQPIFHAILQNELPAFLSLVEERDSIRIKDHRAPTFPHMFP
ncbi:BnaC08g14200D [Brassica napus]|uniref:BnaC08g14200D protein n=1 Tax=Brassica napus TaxID=3708 RepID=A0A078G7Q0_BRANA|nr:BnaC08g14200D [Brassica napus]